MTAKLRRATQMSRGYSDPTAEAGAAEGAVGGAKLMDTLSPPQYSSLEHISPDAPPPASPGIQVGAQPSGVPREAPPAYDPVFTFPGRYITVSMTLM